MQRAKKTVEKGRRAKRGEGLLPIWLTGSAVAVCLLLLSALFGIVLVNGLGMFWPSNVAKIELTDGTVLYGELVGRERVRGATGDPIERINVKVGNRDIYGMDFRWIDKAEIDEISYPPEIAAIERREWGDMYGVITQVRQNDELLADGPDAAWATAQVVLERLGRVRSEIRKIENGPMDVLNSQIEELRLERRRIELRGVDASAARRLADIDAEITRLLAEGDALEAQRQELLAEARQYTVTVELAGDREHRMELFQIIDALQPNRMSTFSKMGAYLVGLWKFLTGEPRESNTEGGIIPALFGTVLMVMIMTIVVVPIGVCAAIYLREYAGNGPIASFVRIAVNNLAGVPSIVFGVFGLGFFVYFVGGSIDVLFFPERLPTPTFGTGGILWASLTLALLTLPVVIVATEEGLAAIDDGQRQASYALGATKFETIRRVILPRSMPAILTGTMLAISRAAGEVAPLMLTGVVKLAPSLVVDGTPPYIHLQRKFMHLGFHIFDVGFQSPNVEAARPMVFATTLVLLAVVILLNIFGIVLRQRLRRRYESSSF